MAPGKKTKKSASGSRAKPVLADEPRAPARMSLARRAYEHLKDGLLKGRYAAGERLSIDAIGKELRVSRFPVLEAMKQLEAEQLVVIKPQVGCSVVRPSAREISDHFRFMARAEGFIAELAAERGSKPEMDSLAFISSQIGLLLSSPMRPEQIVQLYRKLNRDFHGAIHQMAGAPELTTNVAKFFDRNDFFIALIEGGNIFAESLEAAHREHEAIVKALAARDLAAARAAIETHIRKIHDRTMAGLSRSGVQQAR